MKRLGGLTLALAPAPALLPAAALESTLVLLLVDAIAVPVPVSVAAVVGSIAGDNLYCVVYFHLLWVPVMEIGDA